MGTAVGAASLSKWLHPLLYHLEILFISFLGKSRVTRSNEATRVKGPYCTDCRTSCKEVVPVSYLATAALAQPEVFLTAK